MNERGREEGKGKGGRNEVIHVLLLVG